MISRSIVRKSFIIFITDSDSKSDTLDIYNIGKYINCTLETKILIHGWQVIYDPEMGDMITKNYLLIRDYNIIYVDWTEIAKNIIYLEVAAKVSYVAKFVADIINILFESGVNENSLHLIGFSLGAHVAGSVSKYIKPEKINRITGLDPASLSFECGVKCNRLDRSNAQFVDVMHTACGLIGISAAIGHIDFYPNGCGFAQPGCIGWLNIIAICNHFRTYNYYAESISTNVGFYAYKCKDWKTYLNKNCSPAYVLMGEYVNRSAVGIWYLETNSFSPFALGPTMYNASLYDKDKKYKIDN